MGAGSAKLVAQTGAPVVGDASILSLPVGEDGKLTLNLAKDTARNALEAAFVDDAGAVLVTQLRSHMPHNAVAAEYAGNLPFTGAVPGPALVHFVDANGSTAAVLYNGDNDAARSGVHMSTEHSWTWCSADGYRNGEGSSMLYAATSSGHDKFFDSLETKKASELGLAGQACPICMTDFSADDELKVLPCGGKHAFRPKCIQEWLVNHASCPLCRQSAAAGGGPVLTDDKLLHGGDILTKVGVIKPVLSEAQQKRRGMDYRYKGGVGLYPLLTDGSIAAEPALKFDGSKVRTAAKQVVAACPENNGDKPAPKKVQLAAGVDPVLVLALLSEWDANRRGIENAPVEGALAG